jgi:hypothetical protein
MKSKSKYFYNSLTKCTQRKVNIRDIRKILIVCEGEKTEPNYFRAFPKHSEVDVFVDPAGMVAYSVVQKAIMLKDKAENNGDKYHKVWCVFDRDSNPRQNFNRAMQLAKSNDIDVAYSVEAFELWYLLHFELYSTGISRAQYAEKLEGYLGSEYKKNSLDMYKLLHKNQKRAIKFAETLLAGHDNNITNIYDNNPSTTVHLLVIELNRYLGC